jgi:hypothetical protein
LDISFYKVALDTFSRDPKAVRECLFRLSSGIAFDKIVNIETLCYSGHVYDLQVEPSEIYINNGVVVKNCLCLSYSVYSGDATAIDKGAAKNFLDDLDKDDRKALLGVEGERQFQKNPNTWEDNLRNYEGHEDIKDLMEGGL